MTPVQFMVRLAILVPPPYFPLVRYHGVFAAPSSWRARESRSLATAWRGVCASRRRTRMAAMAVSAGDPMRITAPHWQSLLDGELYAAASRIAWAVLLRRPYGVDALRCPKCIARTRVMATVVEQGVLAAAAGSCSGSSRRSSARVEAEQIDLLPRPTAVEKLVTESIRKARELAGDAELPISVELAEGLPLVPVDASYGTRALAVIVAHAIRSATSQPSPRGVRVRVPLPAPPGGRVCIEVEYGSRDVTREELVQLFARQSTGRGEGLTLGLSLARSVIELHGGTVEVSGTQDGLPVCRIYLPMRAPSQRPKLSSFPALG
jgi:signal transduction histidine kinase